MPKTIRPKPDIDQPADWVEAFRSQMTRVSFQLMLTRPMLEFLCACADDVHWDRSRYGSLGYMDNWIATEFALTRRGLVVRRPPQVVKSIRHDHAGFVPPPWELTPAGRAVVDLLKVGGLFIPAQEVADRAAARKGRL
jgi:hypothetical protein